MPPTPAIAPSASRRWDYLAPAFDALRPPPEEGTTDWAEDHVYLRPGVSSESGFYSPDRTPYIRGVHQAHDNIYVEHIILVWGRQTSKSMGGIIVPQLKRLARDPGPAMFLLPNDKLARFASEGRMQKLIKDCDETAAKLTGNDDDLTKDEIKLIDSVITFQGTGKSSGTMSRSIRDLNRDEIDEFTENVGTSANPLTSSEEMTTSYADRKIVDTSTPTTPSGAIWRQLRSCKYVFEYWVPCPSCGEYQIMVWEQIRFDSSQDPEAVLMQTHYECLQCSAEISEGQKDDMCQLGQWRARVMPEDSEDTSADAIYKGTLVKYEDTLELSHVLENLHPRKIGFHLPKWYGLFAGNTMGHAAKAFLEANAELKETGRRKKMEDFQKFWRALPFQEIVETKQEHEVLKNRIEVPQLVCPPGTVAITAGIDQGQGGYWIILLAWHGQARTSKHILYAGFFNAKDDLANFINDSTFEVEGSEERLGIYRAGLDTGGSKYESEDVTMTESAYEFIRDYDREYRSRQLFGTKGASTTANFSGRKMRNTVIERTPKGKPMPGGLTLWHLDTEAFKDAIATAMGREVDQPGRLTLFAEADKTLARHLASEAKIRQRTGKLQWEKRFAANHYFDCVVIATAMGDRECWGGVTVAPAGGTKPRTKNPNKPRRKGFATSW